MTDPNHPNPFHDYVIASRNYWSGRTGRESPPPPSYRLVDGKQTLGRLMDPFGCQGQMAAYRNLWKKFWIRFVIVMGVLILCTEIDIIFLFLEVPIFATIYLVMRARYQRQYDKYYAVCQRIIVDNGEPEWVPYDKDRLKLLDRTPLAVWP